jgi:hypothetical protein
MARSKGALIMSAVPITEQTITNALRRVPPERWPQVLAFIDSLQPPSVPPNSATPARRWTAAELRKLSPTERDAILTEQAAALEDDYRNNPELTAFEAFGDEDLYVDSSDAEALARLTQLRALHLPSSIPDDHIEATKKALPIL